MIPLTLGAASLGMSIWSQEQQKKAQIEQMRKQNQLLAMSTRDNRYTEDSNRFNDYNYQGNNFNSFSFKNGGNLNRGAVRDNTNVQINQLGKKRLVDISLDIDNLSDIEFSNKYGFSKHKWLYENNQEYQQYVNKNSKQNSKDYGSIDLPSSDLRRKDVSNPDQDWMYPNLTNRELKKTQNDKTNEIVGSVAPMPLGEGLLVLRNLKNSSKLNKLKDLFINSKLDTEGFEVANEGNRYIKGLIDSRTIKKAKVIDSNFGTKWEDAITRYPNEWRNNSLIGGNNKVDLVSNILDDETILGQRLDPILSKNDEFERTTSRLLQIPTKAKFSKVLVKSGQGKDIKRILKHELSHDVNDSGNIFTKKYNDSVKKIFYDEDEISQALLDNDNLTIDKLSKIRKDYDYITRPTETNSFFNINARDELIEKGLLKDQWDDLIPEKFDEYMKNSPTLTRFKPFIKNPTRFTSWMNSIPPAAVVLGTPKLLDTNTQSKTREFANGGLIDVAPGVQVGVNNKGGLSGTHETNDNVFFKNSKGQSVSIEPNETKVLVGETPVALSNRNGVNGKSFSQDFLDNKTKSISLLEASKGVMTRPERNLLLRESQITNAKAMINIPKQEKYNEDNGLNDTKQFANGGYPDGDPSDWENIYRNINSPIVTNAKPILKTGTQTSPYTVDLGISGKTNLSYKSSKLPNPNKELYSSLIDNTANLGLTLYDAFSKPLPRPGVQLTPTPSVRRVNPYGQMGNISNDVAKAMNDTTLSTSNSQVARKAKQQLLMAGQAAKNKYMSDVENQNIGIDNRYSELTTNINMNNVNSINQHRLTGYAEDRARLDNTLSSISANVSDAGNNYTNFLNNREARALDLKKTGMLLGGSNPRYGARIAASGSENFDEFKNLVSTLGFSESELIEMWKQYGKK